MSTIYRQLIGLLGSVWGAILLLPSSAGAVSFHQVSTTDSQGLGNQPIPTLQVSPTWGLTISFIPSAELIQQVRVGDPSRIVVDFDSPLSSDAGATVIYLRQLGQPLELNARLTAQARNTNEMLLSVVTIDRQGDRHLHQFLLLLGQTPTYSTVEVVPDLVLAQRRLSASQREAQSRPRSTDIAAQLELGLAQTELAPQMQSRIQRLLALLRLGASIESAATATEVPIALVDQILDLATDP